MASKSNNEGDIYYLSFIIPQSCNTDSEVATKQALEDIVKGAAADNRKHGYLRSHPAQGDTLKRAVLFKDRKQIPRELQLLNLEQKPPYHGIIGVKIDPNATAHNTKHRRLGSVDTQAINLGNLYEVFLPKTPESTNRHFKNATSHKVNGVEYLAIKIDEKYRLSDTSKPQPVATDFHNMKFGR